MCDLYIYIYIDPTADYIRNSDRMLIDNYLGYFILMVISLGNNSSQICQELNL